MRITIPVVSVRLSELHTQQRPVPPWELPVLQAVHGASAVTQVGQTKVDMERPSAEAEYERLAARYKGGEVPYVAQVYGRHDGGIANLQAAIDGNASKKAKSRAAPTDEPQ